MPSRRTQWSPRGSQRSTRSSQHAAPDLTDKVPISRITLRLARNPATDEDIGNIDEGTQPNDTQEQKNEIETSHEQASIELRTLNVNISDLNIESVKSVSQVKIFIFIEALAEKNQILDNNKLMKFDWFFDVCLLHERYIQQCEDWTAKQDKTIQYKNCEAVLSSVKRSVQTSTVSLEKESD